jgi:hypothetical protein
MAYWKEHPPTHVLVAAYLMGGKRSSAGKTRRQAQSDLGDLTQAVSFAGGRLNKKLPLFYRT